MAEVLLFDKSLQKISFIFRLLGLNIGGKRDFKKVIRFFFSVSWHLTDVIATIIWLIGGISGGLLRGEGFIDLTYVAPCTIIGIISEIKVNFLYYEKSKADSLVDIIRGLEIKANKLVNSESDNLIANDTKFLNVVINLLNVINSTLLVLFTLSPLIFIAVTYFTTGRLELLLPLFDIYPFDSLNLRRWPFAYFHQSWSICVCISEICAVDYFFFTCCTHIRMQFKLLQHQFQEVVASKRVPARDLIDHMTVLTKFQQLVKWHQKVIRAVNMMEEIYTKPILLNFVGSSMIICLTGFNVTTIDDTAMAVSSILFLSSSLMQVFFLCLFGDFLMSSSVDVADAVYDSRWYLSDEKTRKNLLIVQTRALNPCKLTAAGFANVNLRAFMKILSTSWSYFALLQTIYGSRS